MQAKVTQFPQPERVRSQRYLRAVQWQYALLRGPLIEFRAQVVSLSRFTCFGPIHKYNIWITGTILVFCLFRFRDSPHKINRWGLIIAETVTIEFVAAAVVSVVFGYRAGVSETQTKKKTVFKIIFCTVTASGRLKREDTFWKRSR